MTENQNPEQKARDNIDALLWQAGRIVQSFKVADSCCVVSINSELSDFRQAR